MLAGVGVRQRVRHLARDPERVVERQLRLAAEPVAQRGAVHEGHDVVEEAVRGTGVVEGKDVGMLELGRDADLAEEALGSDGSRDIGREDLHGDGSAVLAIVRQVHARHPAPADLALDLVPTRERGPQAVQLIRERGARAVRRVRHGTILLGESLL
jgi:hypothetical protein